MDESQSTPVFLFDFACPKLIAGAGATFYQIILPCAAASFTVH